MGLCRGWCRSGAIILVGFTVMVRGSKRTTQEVKNSNSYQSDLATEDL